MITLNGIELNNSLLWTDRYQGDLISSSARRTIGGRLVISSVQLIAGLSITLQATEDYGWLTRDQLEAVQSIADQNGIYVLQFGLSETYDVQFRHFDSPAVDFTPLVGRTDDAPTDYFIGQIKLITV